MKKYRSEDIIRARRKKNNPIWKTPQQKEHATQAILDIIIQNDISWHELQTKSSLSKVALNEIIKELMDENYIYTITTHNEIRKFTFNDSKHETFY